MVSSDTGSEPRKGNPLHILSVTNGFATVKGRKLPAAIVAIELLTINKAKATYGTAKAYLAGVRDEEFGIWRELGTSASREGRGCSRSDEEHDRAIEAWRREVSFESSNAAKAASLRPALIPEAPSTHTPDNAPLSPAPTEEDAMRSRAPDAEVPTLSGRWQVFVSIDHTTYRALLGLTAEYALTLTQSGTDFSAKGHKIAENGRSIPEASQDVIELVGSVHRDKLEATYTLHGSQRESTGRFSWVVSVDGRGLEGAFWGDRSETNGRSWGTRLP